MAAPKRAVTIEITLNADGNLVVQIPHDRNQTANANAAAKFTDKLSKAIGKVLERHIGDHEHNVTTHTHNHNTHTH